jgi:hypothetical protein
MECNSTRLCKAMRKVWRINGNDNNNETDDDVNNDIMGLETSLGTVKDTRSLVGKQKCYECGKHVC